MCPRPLLLGHRGARGLKSTPENTFSSFDLALAEGCDGFEFDVRLTADGIPVICHDAEARGIEIAHATAQELNGLPTLAEVLERYLDRAFLDIELKVAGLEEVTIALLQAHPAKKGCVVSSFLPEVLQALHRKDSKIPLGLICETRVELRRWKQLPVEYVIPHYKLLDAAQVRQLKAASKKIIIWTVNASANIRRFARAGVDGIISDRPTLLVDALSS